MWAALLKPLIKTAIRQVTKQIPKLLQGFSKFSNKLKLPKIFKGKGKGANKSQRNLDVFSENNQDLQSIGSSNDESNFEINETDSDSLPRKISNSDEEIDNIATKYDVEDSIIQTQDESDLDHFMSITSDMLKRSKKKLDEKFESKEIDSREYLTELLREFDEVQSNRLAYINKLKVEGDDKIIAANASSLKLLVKSSDESNVSLSESKELINYATEQSGSVTEGLSNLMSGQKQTAMSLGKSIEHSSMVQGMLTGIINFLGTLDPFELILTLVALALKPIKKLLQYTVEPIEMSIKNIKDWAINIIDYIPFVDTNGYDTYSEVIEGKDENGNPVVKVIEYRLFKDGTTKVVDVFTADDSDIKKAKEGSDNFKYIGTDYGKSLYNTNKANWDRDTELISLREKNSLPVGFMEAEVSAEDQIAKGENARSKLGLGEYTSKSKDFEESLSNAAEGIATTLGVDLDSSQLADYPVDNQKQKTVIANALGQLGLYPGYSCRGNPFETHKQGKTTCCSFVTQDAYKSVGIDIGSGTAMQIGKGQWVDRGGGYGIGGKPDLSKLKPGDLLFFDTTLSKDKRKAECRDRPFQVGHVSMYVGNGKTVDGGGGAKVNGKIPGMCNVDKHMKNYIGAKRILPATKEIVQPVEAIKPRVQDMLPDPEGDPVTHKEDIAKIEETPPNTEPEIKVQATVEPTRPENKTEGIPTPTEMATDESLVINQLDNSQTVAEGINQAFTERNERNSENRNVVQTITTTIPEAKEEIVISAAKIPNIK